MSDAELKKTINWDEAMNQVGGDVDFLKEVLNDLLSEVRQAQEDIERAITTTPITSKEFLDIQKAAHRIKGSASYLCCEELRECAYQLQEAGSAGSRITSGDFSAQLDTIKSQFTDFQTAVAILETVISEKTFDA